MFQKCPVCDGFGNVYSSLLTSQQICSVCNGQKIIHQVTGQPPNQNLALKVEGIGTIQWAGQCQDGGIINFPYHDPYGSLEDIYNKGNK